MAFYIKWGGLLKVICALSDGICSGVDGFLLEVPAERAKKTQTALNRNQKNTEAPRARRIYKMNFA
jgi:hypothetical protein